MRLIAVVVALTLMPGVAEAVADVAHYLTEGHTLHEAPVVEAAHDGHSQHEQGHDSDEHGCSTLFHLCGCHSPTPSVMSAFHAVGRPNPLEEGERVAAAGPARLAADGVLGLMLRPPIA